LQTFWKNAVFFQSLNLSYRLFTWTLEAILESFSFLAYLY
jgi:hypothetical protein